MLNKERVLWAFTQALLPHDTAPDAKRLKPRAVALRAHRIYCEGLPPDAKRPSAETFRKFACGPTALPEVADSLGSAGVRSTERGRLNRDRLVAAFRSAAEALLGEETRRKVKSSSVARRAYEIYLGQSDPADVRPSYHSFRRLVYGKSADPEILSLLKPALAREAKASLPEDAALSAAKRARLDHRRLHAVFRKAIHELKADLFEGRAKLLQVARRAHALYLQETDDRSPKPTVHAFQRLVYGRTADPVIAALIASSLPDQRDVLKAFERALEALAQERNGGIRPRTVAVRAHSIFSSALPKGAKRPSVETFRKLASGRRTLPEVGEMLKAAGVLPALRARLDRGRLRAVFEEAVQRLEARIFKGQAKPMQIARRAYEIYTRDADGRTPPSRQTFQRLIYGKTADPEILTLIRTARKGEE